MGVVVAASVSTDPVRQPARRDSVPCLLHVVDGVLHVRRRLGGPLLQVPVERVRTAPATGGVALALDVDGFLLRLDFRLPGRRAEGPARVLRHGLGLVADARAVARRGLLSRALR
ncbi:hypothetical protein SAMN04488544_3520 [Microlunatus sagamiharensis]|uniref:Uncharacterized protein n=1 Tax=Microlunatus sagamiharensis TaxID=546874 RepID=A0A1H2N8H0_9ACTN|nr:hypothetical protein [Microlunatus sagamiharensis]SDV01692.1 hypothetical protein SAMN04488544_3520 [Microlunatus sagamiharensis]